MDLTNIAWVLSFEPDLSEAKRVYEQALAIQQEIGDRSTEAATLGNYAGVLAKQGDLAASRVKREQALAIRTAIGEIARPPKRGAISPAARESGDFTRAEAMAREAVEEFRKEKLPDSEAETRAVLARALLAQGKVQDAQHTIDVAAKLLTAASGPPTRLFVRHCTFLI
jgi:tetratricopeptide (TPR) repeat protein